VAIADRNSLAGVVRGHAAAKRAGIPFIPAARLDFSDGTPSLLCLPTDRPAYARLSLLLTLGKRRTTKGDCQLGWDDLSLHSDGQILIVLPPDDALPDEDFANRLAVIAAGAPPARPWWRPTTCSITRPRAARWPMC
jgi:error-prone DNA polymerase